MAGPIGQSHPARTHGSAAHQVVTSARPPVSPQNQVQPHSPLVAATSTAAHANPQKQLAEGSVIQPHRRLATATHAVSTTKDASAAQNSNYDGRFCLEVLRIAELSIESLPATKRGLPLTFTSNDGGTSATKTAAVGRNHQPELFETWLPNESLRNCISRTAFEIILAMRGDSLGPILMVRGSNPLKVNGRAVQQNVGVVLTNGSEIGFDYNPPGPQPFLLLSFQFNLTSSSNHADQGLAKAVIPCQVPGAVGPAVSTPAPAVDRHVAAARSSPWSKWHLACIHAEGKSAEALAALPLELRQLEVPTGTLLLGRERQDRFFEAVLAGGAASEFFTFISRTHLELVVNPDADYISVKNLSQNPVYVNKQPIAKGKLSALFHNQMLSFARPEGSAGGIKHVHFLVLQLRAVGREHRPGLTSSAADTVSETTPKVQRSTVEASPHPGAPVTSTSACASGSTPQTPVQATCSPDLPKAEPDRPEAASVVPPPLLGSPSLEPPSAGAPRPSILPGTALMGSRRGSDGPAQQQQQPKELGLAESEREMQSPINGTGGQVLDIVANLGTCPPDGAHAIAPAMEHHVTANQQETTCPSLEPQLAPQDPEETLQLQRVERIAVRSPLSAVQPEAHAELPEARPAIDMEVTQITEDVTSNSPLAGAIDVTHISYDSPLAGARPWVPLDVTQIAEDVSCTTPSAMVTLELFGEAVLDVLPAQRRIGPISLLGAPLTVGRKHQPDLHKGAVKEECLRFVSREHFRISFDGSSFRLHALTGNPIYRFRESTDPVEVACGEEAELRSGDQIALGTGCDDVFDAIEDAHRRLCWHFMQAAAEISPYDNEPSSPGGMGPRVSMGPWSSRVQEGAGGYPAPPLVDALRSGRGGDNEDKHWTAVGCNEVQQWTDAQPRQERASDVWGPVPRSLGGPVLGASDSSALLPRFGDTSPRLQPVLEESYPKFGCNDDDSPDARTQEYLKSLEMTRTDF